MTGRPLDSGRTDTLGRRIRVTGATIDRRATAPPPSDTTPALSGDEFYAAIHTQLAGDDRWPKRQRDTQFRLTRLLDRVFTHCTHTVMLKGGMRRLAISPMARFTDDADTWVNANLDDAINDIIGAVEADLGDHLEYRHARTDRYDHHPHAAKIHFTVTFNGRPWGETSIDVSTKARITTPPAPIAPPRIVDVPLEQPAGWMSYSTADQVADKVAAIFEPDPRGGGSRRYHDLVDVELAAVTERVTASQLREALRVEFKARGLDWPERFDVPDRASWSVGYRKRAGGIPELRGRSIPEALERVGKLIDPILADPDFQGVWDPEQETWLSG